MFPHPWVLLLAVGWSHAEPGSRARPVSRHARRRWHEPAPRSCHLNGICPVYSSDMAAAALQAARGVYAQAPRRPANKPMAWASTALVTMSDRNGLRMLENFLCSLARLQLKAAVATLDVDALAWMERRGGFTDESRFRALPWLGNMSGATARGFLELDRIKWGLASFAFVFSLDILVVDADMVWQADPLPTMAPLVLARRVDAIVQTGPSGVKD